MQIFADAFLGMESFILSAFLCTLLLGEMVFSYGSMSDHGDSINIEQSTIFGATWFLPALFWVSVSVHLFVSRFNEKKYCRVALLVLGVAACTVGFYITFPYRISRTLICSLFYVCGYCWKSLTDCRMREFEKNVGACICIIVFLLIATHNIVSLGGDANIKSFLL